MARDGRAGRRRTCITRFFATRFLRTLHEGASRGFGCRVTMAVAGAGATAAMPVAGPGAMTAPARAIIAGGNARGASGCHVGHPALEARSMHG